MCNSLYVWDCYKNTCIYQYFYGNSASTAGVLANETFTFGTNDTRVSVPKIAFGYGTSTPAPSTTVPAWWASAGARCPWSTS
jgi:hypothetical protein